MDYILKVIHDNTIWRMKRPWCWKRILCWIWILEKTVVEGLTELYIKVEAIVSWERKSCGLYLCLKTEKQYSWSLCPRCSFFLLWRKNLARFMWWSSRAIKMRTISGSGNPCNEVGLLKPRASFSSCLNGFARQKWFRLEEGDGMSAI